MTAKQQKMVLSRQAYDYDVSRPEGKQRVRPPHPVTMMLKNVLKGVIELLELPPNPLDHLVHLCGGRDVVAEMTGRKEMMECQSDGKWRPIKRAADGVKQQELNIHVRPLPLCLQLHTAWWASHQSGRMCVPTCGCSCAACMPCMKRWLGAGTGLRGG